MKRNFVDCFMLMNTALSLNGGKKLSEMGRPLIQDVHSTIVNVSVTIQDLKFINIKRMEMQVDLLLHQRWIDPRLGANVKTRKMAVAGQIWKPKITNTNGIIASCFNNLEDTVFWRGYGSEGKVLLSERSILKIFCSTNFRKFPFDIQTCELNFGTYRFPNDEVELIWDIKPIEILSDDLPEFKLIKFSTSTTNELRHSGNFTILTVQLTMRRYSLHYIICSGISSIITVLLCYITFWINIGQVGVRYILNAASVTILLYIYYTSSCVSLSVPYLKCQDIFILLCISFALMSTIETLLVDLLSSKSTDIRIKKGSFQPVYPKSVSWIERSFKLAYPVLYIFCVLLYCIMYAN